MSFTSLPDEITENILARVSRWDYPKLSLVSKTFHSLLSSMNIYKTRARIGTTETSLYVCLELDMHYKWFTLRSKPNQTLTRTITKLLSEKNSSGKVLAPLPILASSPHSRTLPFYSTIAVGHDIYVIGGTSKPSSTVHILDCWSHTWRDAPNLKVAREYAYAVSVDEKLYVMGGCASDHDANWLEVFDIKTQSWTAFPVPFADVELYGYIRVNVVQGMLYVMTQSKDYTYDPKQGTWKVLREKSKSKQIDVWCVVEDVMYCYTHYGEFMRYDLVGGNWDVIKGLDDLGIHAARALSKGWLFRLVNYGGNLLAIWRPMLFSKNVEIWYAEISIETRCNGSEIWGSIEWIDNIPHQLRYMGYAGSDFAQDPYHFLQFSSSF